MSKSQPRFFARLFRNSLLLALFPLTVLTLLSVAALNTIIAELGRADSAFLSDPEQYVGGLRVALGLLSLYLLATVVGLAFVFSRLATSQLSDFARTLRGATSGRGLRHGGPIRASDDAGGLGQAVDEVLDELSGLQRNVIGQVARLQVFDEVALSIASLHPLGETLGLIAGAVPRLVRARVTVIALLEPDGSLDFHGGENAPDARATVQCLARRLLRESRQGSHVSDAHPDDELAAATPEHIAAAPRWKGNTIAVPLQGRGQPIGLLWAGFGELEQLGADEIRVLELLAAHAAIAVENVRMFEEVGRMEAIRHLNSAKQEFIAQVSHELRTPLSLVRGYAELLSEREVPRADAARMIGEIHDAACRMSRIVDDLLDVSRLESGRLSLRREPIDISDAVQTAVRTFQAGPGALRRLEVHLDDRHSVLADRERVVQVLLNFLSNAAVYSPADSPIVLTTCLDSSQLRISVSDEGIGIAPEERDRIFDKFYRIETALKHRVKGTGLGLAICQTIVDAHGGRIWVDSRPGRGSTFSFTLPLADIPAGILA
ncbi:MAG: GAF domain-containing protein [Chloroflexi bacterium]|nr:GAF domain-containing protein [Chloroflexota bacterium]